jgi:hypothetical protein
MVHIRVIELSTCVPCQQVKNNSGQLPYSYALEY